jgi:biopolymer transport protein ExbB
MNNTFTKHIIAIATLITFVSARVVSAAEPPPSPSSFQRFFVDGGLLVWILLLLSLLTIKLIVQYFLAVRRSQLLPPTTLQRVADLLTGTEHRPTLDLLTNDQSLIGRTLYAGLTEAAHGGAAVRMAITESLEQDTANLLRKIEWLNLIGNVAPMIGLFGTVWGMIEAFNGIVQAGGQPQPADLAAGISVALVTTWWGLIVAIPALAAFGFLRNRIDSLTAEVALTCEKLLANIHDQS